MLFGETSKDPEIKFLRGMQYLYGLCVPRDPDKAFPLLVEAAESGIRWAQYEVARMFADGAGVERTDVGAVVWLRRAAELGHMPSALELGCVLMDGPENVRDQAAAFDWLARAVELGSGEAAAKLGSLFEYGELVAPDRLAALEWYGKSAEMGSAAGLWALARIFRDGLLGTPKDARKADEYEQRAVSLRQLQQADELARIREAAFAGCRHAQQFLGHIYLNGGYGVEADQEKAEFWLALAAARTEEPGRDSADGIVD